MKLVMFTLGDNPRLGLVRENEVIDLTRASEGYLPSDMLTFLRQGQPALELAQDIEQSAAADLPLTEVKLLAPVTTPSKVVAIGLNLGRTEFGIHDGASATSREISRISADCSRPYGISSIRYFRGVFPTRF